MRGRWHLAQGNAADNERAKQFLTQAITLDATFASPYAALAIAGHNSDGNVYGTRPPQDAIKLAAIWAQKATAIDPDDADAHAMLALSASWAGTPDVMRDHVRLALNANPNAPFAVALAVRFCSTAVSPPTRGHC